MNGRQKDVVLILARELASNLATPMLILDHHGTVVFFNEAAEAVLGAPFAQVGEVAPTDWEHHWPITYEDGSPFSMPDSPLARVITDEAPGHQVIFMTGLDGVKRRVSATAYPLIGSTHRLVGAVGVFWQEDDGS